jgi:hypothetical protein
MHDEAFNIDKGPPGAAGDVRELFSRNQLSGAVEARNEQNGGVEVEPLGERRRRDDNFENPF